MNLIGSGTHAHRCAVSFRLAVGALVAYLCGFWSQNSFLRVYTYFAGTQLVWCILRGLHSWCVGYIFDPVLILVSLKFQFLFSDQPVFSRLTRCQHIFCKVDLSCFYSIHFCCIYCLLLIVRQLGYILTN